MVGSRFEEQEVLRKAAQGVLRNVSGSRPVSAWTVGSARDALVVTSVLRCVAEASTGRAEPKRLFEMVLSPTEALPAGEEASARRRCGGDPRARHRRRYRDETPDEQILIGLPRGPVDLVALRPSCNAGEGPPIGAIASRLSPGGQLVLLGPAVAGSSTTRIVSVGRLQALDTSGRLFVKPPETSSTISHGETGGLTYASAAGNVTLTDYRRQAQLVSSYGNLARALAGRFAGRGQSRDDLEQVAMLALFNAARRYHPEHPAAFASYATATILGELKRHFRDKAWMIRPPRSLQERHLAVRAARDELSQANGETPSTRQIAGHMGLSEEDVLAAMEAAQDFTALSLDTPSAEDGGTGIELPAQDDALESTLSACDLKEGLNRLAPSEKLLIRRIFFDGWTQREFAQNIGVSQMQVSRMLARTLETLRTAMATA